MTDQSAQEPTMEEILASIRRIISEDDAPAEAAPAAETDDATDVQMEAAADDQPSPALMDETPSMQEPAASEEDVLELTDRYEEPPAPAAPPASESMGDLDIGDPAPFPAAEPEPEPEPEPAPASAARERVASPAPDYDALVGESAAASAASAFAGLTASLKPPKPAEAAIGSGPTIDELARALLRPLLKEWLDANLPGIVEAEVRKEVERIARESAR